MNYQRRIPSREETRKRADTLDGRDLTVHNEQEPVAEVSESVNEDSLRQAEERIEVLVCRCFWLYTWNYWQVKNVIGGI